MIIIERSSDYQLDYIHFINDMVHSKNQTSVIIVFQKPCKSHTETVTLQTSLSFFFPLCRPARTWTCPSMHQTISIWTSPGQLGQQVLTTLFLFWIFTFVLMHKIYCFFVVKLMFAELFLHSCIQQQVATLKKQENFNKQSLRDFTV